MKKALIEGARVVEVRPENADPLIGPFPVAAPLVWVDCPDEATPETHCFDGEAVVPNAAPPEPSARELILKQLAEIDRATGSVRWIRELALGFAELHGILAADGIALPALGTGMAKVQAIEEQCRALRAQLAAL